MREHEAPATTTEIVVEAVTPREVNEKLDAMRREMKLWIALGLVSGQTVASLVTAYVTRLSPPDQVKAVSAFLIRHLF